VENIRCHSEIIKNPVFVHVQAARAHRMGRMLRRQRGVLSAWASWLEANWPCPTAVATSSASDVSSHGQR